MACSVQIVSPLSVVLVPMCRKFGNVRRFWRGRKEMEFTYLVKLSNPCRTPKSIVDRELIFVYFIRIQQGTRKVLWIRHHVLLKTKAKDVSTANQRTEFKVPSEILLLRCGGADGYGTLGEVVKLVWIAGNPFNTVPQQVSIEMFMLLHRNSTKKRKVGAKLLLQLRRLTTDKLLFIYFIESVVHGAAVLLLTATR